ncbi:MAG: LysE family transporter [Chloroflexota bacterium]
MDQLVALVAFSAVSSGTPGPNNLLLWASGAEFGVRRTIPHVLGTAVGLGAMALGVAAGLGAAIIAIPTLAFSMKLAGSVYLLYLAWQVAGAHALSRASIARPMSLIQAAAFQVINPKAWIFALGAITTFRPPELPILAGSLLVAAVMMVVIVPTAGLWAAAGGAIGRLLVDERRRRIVSLVLAVILALTVVSVWR